MHESSKRASLDGLKHESKVKSCYEPGGPSVPVLNCCLLLPGWDASSLQGYPPAL